MMTKDETILTAQEWRKRLEKWLDEKDFRQFSAEIKRSLDEFYNA